MMLPYLLGAMMAVGQAPAAPVGTLGTPEIFLAQPKTPEPVPAQKKESSETPKNGNGNGEPKKKERYPSAIFGPHLPDGPQGKGFFPSLVRAYVKEFRKGDNDDGEDSPP